MCVTKCLEKFHYRFKKRDLKRDISRKLDKLERHTQKAIIDIIRQSTRPPLYTLHFFITPGERIQSDSESLTLANAVMNTDN
jgi:hypothetical protein